MLKRILFLLLLIPGTAAAQIILVVGDSLSAAYGIPVEQGWVRLLQQTLDDRGHQHLVVNDSISGDTSANGLARLSRSLQTHEPDLVILELGGNDGLRGLSLEAMQRNLEAMIVKARASGAEVLLIGVQLPPNYGPRYTELFTAIYHELATEYGVALLPSMVDGIGTERELMQADGIHPNAMAQPLIRDRVLEKLMPLLQRADRKQTLARESEEQAAVSE